MTTSNWQKERNIAEQAALQAGARIREFYKKDPWVKEKSPKNFITQADHEANEIIQALIRENFPEDGWLSEETQEDAEEHRKERLWVVDPLDGTYEFVHSLPEFAVSIALCSGGVPVVGVVYNPATEELFSGSEGEGVFFNNVSRKLSICKNPKEMRILVSRSEFNRKEVDFLKDRLVLVPKGGTAYKLALVAAGLYEGSLSVQPKTNWDFAAGMALLKAAGALVSDNKGQILEKLPPKVSGLCVASPQMHSTLVRWIRDVDVPDCRAKKPSTT